MMIWGAWLVAGTLALMPAAARAQDAVKIGILNDQSGNYAEFGGLGSVEAAKMAIEDFGGSVLGKPIEIIAADHQNKPDIAAGLARRWYDADGVTAIADLTNSAVALAVAGIDVAAVDRQDQGRLAIVVGRVHARFHQDKIGKRCRIADQGRVVQGGIAVAILGFGIDALVEQEADPGIVMRLDRDVQRGLARRGVARVEHGRPRLGEIFHRLVAVGVAHGLEEVVGIRELRDRRRGTGEQDPAQHRPGNAALQPHIETP